MSFASWGKEAEFVIARHELAYSLGERSPLARIYELHGRILLIGVGYDRNTSFHLAEYRVPASAADDHRRALAARRWKSVAGI